MDVMSKVNYVGKAALMVLVGSMALKAAKFGAKKIAAVAGVSIPLLK